MSLVPWKGAYMQERVERAQVIYSFLAEVRPSICTEAAEGLAESKSQCRSVNGFNFESVPYSTYRSIAK